MSHCRSHFLRYLTSLLAKEAGNVMANSCWGEPGDLNSAVQSAKNAYRSLPLGYSSQRVYLSECLGEILPGFNYIVALFIICDKEIKTMMLCEAFMEMAYFRAVSLILSPQRFHFPVPFIHRANTHILPLLMSLNMEELHVRYSVYLIDFIGRQGKSVGGGC